MGIVYRVEQTEPVRRELALKLLKTGSDRGRLASRFASERQTLALMDHPHIATMLDSGADEDGRPYFVMELVRGVPITDYCETEDLDLRERVRLFLTVCRAVRHAHQKGVIHRDLKPSNVLVTLHDGKPFPVVIDFGVAKAVAASEDERPDLTVAGQVVGTPDYMSPEQVAGDPGGFDLRADVYSLGVILYRLLSGRLPYDVRRSSIVEAARVIRETSPRPLDTRDGTSPRIDADLVTITHKALDKDPDRRYHSAAALAEDLERYLAAEPILAHPPSAIYQLRKMVARHRLPVAFAATVFVLLLGFGLTMSVLYQGQSRARERAEVQTRKAERINEFLQSMLADENPRDLGRDVTVPELLDAAAAKIDVDLSDEPEVEAAVRRTLGRSYVALDRFDEAAAQFRSARDVLGRTLGEGHPEVAGAILDEADIFERRGEYAQAESLAVIAHAIHAADGSDPEGELACREALGSLLVSQSRHDEAEPVLRRAAEDRRRLSGLYHRSTASAYRNLANLYYVGNRYAESESLVAICRDIYERVGPRDNLARNTEDLGVLAQILGKYETSERLLRESIDIYVDLFGEDHSRTSAAKTNLAVTLQTRGDFAAAETLFRETLAFRTGLHGEGSLPVHWSRMSLANNLMGQGRFGEAEVLLDRQYAFALETFGERNHRFGRWFQVKAAILAARGDGTAADSCYSRAQEIYTAVFGDEHWRIAGILRGRGNLAADGGDLESAEHHLRACLAMLNNIYDARNRQVLSARRALATLRLDRGHPAEAEPELRACLADMRDALGDAHWEIAMAGFTLGRCLEALDRREEAVRLVETHLPILVDSTTTPVRARRSALMNAVELYEAWDRPDRAEEYRRATAELVHGG